MNVLILLPHEEHDQRIMANGSFSFPKSLNLRIVSVHTFLMCFPTQYSAYHACGSGLHAPTIF